MRNVGIANSSIFASDVQQPQQPLHAFHCDRELQSSQRRKKVSGPTVLAGIELWILQYRQARTERMEHSQIGKVFGRNLAIGRDDLLGLHRALLIHVSTAADQGAHFFGLMSGDREKMHLVQLVQMSYLEAQSSAMIAVNNPQCVRYSQARP
jgi:hypothetical protein